MAHATDHAAKVSPACPAWQQHRLGRSVAHAYVAESRSRRLTQGRAAAIHVSFARGPGQSGARVVRARVQDGTCTKEFRGHRSGVLGMAVHMGYMYTASSDCTIRVWSLAVRFAAAAIAAFRGGTRRIGAGTRPMSAPGLALCPWRGLHTCSSCRAAVTPRAVLPRAGWAVLSRIVRPRRRCAARPLTPAPSLHAPSRV